MSLNPVIMIPSEIAEAVSKLHLEHGDVLVVRVADPDLIASVHDAFRQWLASYDFSDVRLLIVQEGVSIEALDDAEMAEYGWVRRPKRLLHEV